MGGELTYIENTSKEDVDGLPDVTDKQRCKVPEAPFVKKVSKKKVRKASISSPHTPKAKNDANAQLVHSVGLARNV